MQLGYISSGSRTIPPEKEDANNERHLTMDREKNSDTCIWRRVL
jgi:hypothetical protein